MRAIASARITLPFISAFLLLGVACQKDPTYDISGRVAGLAGTGLVLRVGIAPDLSVSADGPVQFAGTWKQGTAFEVTVAAQPTGPRQTCTVVSNHEAMPAADELFAVTCVTDSFTLGGSASGLSGRGLVLQNAGIDLLAVEANGAFSFGRPVESGGAYDVAIRAQPTEPSQSCVVTGGSGTVVSGAVSSVAVSCDTNRFSVGGTVSGLKGAGLVLQDAGGDDLAVNANGGFAFATPRASGASYAVTVLTQPTGPAQTCSVESGSGLVAGSPVTAAVVTCVTNSYGVGGSVSGLAGSGLMLRLNGGRDLVVAADGAFRFAGAVEAGQAWEVSVAIQPSGPAQTCAVAGGSGTVVAGEVLSVAVRCDTRTFTVGGNVTNLSGTGLVLQQGGVGDLPISARGGFAFASPVASGASYEVTVKTQPTSPWQTCRVTAGSGTVASAPVADVVVSCVTDSYPVGGVVSGLAGAPLLRAPGPRDARGPSGLVLGNAGQAITVLNDGSFELPAVVSGSSYAVTLVAQPTWPSQTCTVVDGTGVMAGAAVTTVAVTCATNLFTVGGTATGMPPASMRIISGGEVLFLDFDGPWAFTTPVASGASYDVQVLSQPPTLACSIAQGTGVVGSEPVTSVEVTCGCAGGLADCDGNPGNGCEQDVEASPSNCGACGRACDVGETCQAGACVPPAAG